ncbi:hypothetical protein [Candidatus Mesenet endosymbiont of Phosphuga atrata]|uniref:hypothetical protein n=1 Tax=Candidatus Mesenet endosymbiont of Phosphuga atrata TaxID=3066221 RepID=UPI0030D5570F
MVGEVINFLQEQKRYRIFWWGFGGSLFNHLCGALGFNAKYLLENEENEEVKDQLYGLVYAYGEMPAYHWWPWSRKIKDISLSQNQKERVKNYPYYRLWYRFVLNIFTSISLHFYLEKWHKLSYQGDEMVKKHKVGRTKNINDLSHIHFLNQETQISDDVDVVPEEGITFSFGKIEDSIMQLSLKEALELFGLPKLLERLDHGLYAMRSHQTQKEDYEKYFNEEVNQKFKKLSLAYHPDKVADEDKKRATEMQQGVNTTRRIMKNLYEHAISNHTSVLNRDFQYSFYANVEIGLLSNKDKLEQLNDKILDKLWWISKVSHAHLTSLLDKFLVASKSTMEKHLLDEKKDFQSLEWDIERKVLKAADEYIERYRGFTEELAKLHKDCQDDEDLKYIKSSVSKLLERCELQCNILSSAQEFFKERSGYIFSYLINPKPYSLAERENYEKVDEYFVLPVIEYLNILFISCELAKKAEKKKSKGLYKKSRKFISSRIGSYVNQTEVASEASEELSNDKTSEEMVLEKMQELPRAELHELCYYLMSYRCYNLNKEDLFNLLQRKFQAGEINKKEAEGLVYKLISQYLARLTCEFTPKRTLNDALADYERLAKKVEEILEKAQEVQKQQERIAEDHKKIEEQLEKQSEQLEQLEKNNKNQKEQAQQLEQRLDNIEQVLKQFKEAEQLHSSTGEESQKPNPTLEGASICGEDNILTQH